MTDIKKFHLIPEGDGNKHATNMKTNECYCEPHPIKVGEGIRVFIHQCFKTTPKNVNFKTGVTRFIEHLKKVHGIN